ncbi:MAG TPA: TRAP transporter substrate-binding protein [Candidatus Bipolaricaulota bacterium]
MKQMHAVTRRRFLTSTALAGALPLLASCNQGPTPSNQPSQTQNAQSEKFQWKMVTTWPPNFPILQTGAERFAAQVKALTKGSLEIEVYAGGELVPALGAFDAVSSGTAQASSSSAYYWAGTVPAAQFFTSVPFGFTYEQMMAWLFGGGGLELWQETYDPFGLVAFPMMTTGVQMGGWFNRKLESLADLQGLKMRMPGLGGAVLAKAGVSTVNLPGAEIFTAMETGTIDACEWVGPYHDVLLGFPQVARYYYHPGWHEPGPVTELAINKDAWDKLPAELQQIVRAVAMDVTNWSFAQFETENAKALAKIHQEFPDVEILRFPDEVLREFKRLTQVVFDEVSAQDAQFARVRQAYEGFAASLAGWSKISLESYLAALAL